EVSQYTFYKKTGIIDLSPISVKLTYGIERISMYLQGVDNVFDLKWNDEITYRDVFHQQEVEQSKYNFEIADIDMLFDNFNKYEAEAHKVLKHDIVLPAYECCLKCSHIFNLLDARGAISVTERTGYIKRIRDIARACSKIYVEQREALGFPLLKDEALREKVLKTKEEKA
ncbi:MAG: glycine--tRNA ligase subunit alpha, partial [Desulfobacteraceae bacterium]|nr:glycine--tRNA ligase subunit alpha [Desulfobacteraceae bacterium]